jgi:site-specific recombinase XerD
MQIRNFAPLTQTSYLQQVSLFARHFGQSPEGLGREEIRAYQIYLALDKRLAASSISVAVAALRFLYTTTLKRDWNFEEGIPTGRRPQKLPNVLSQEEVSQFLNAVRNLKHRVILAVCYAAGLRVFSEAVRLKTAAVDSRRMVIRVEGVRDGRIAT